MMRRVFDSVRHRIHLPVLHHHLHPERSLSLREQALLHPLEQNQRLLDGSVSPGRRRSVVALQFLPFLVAHICMTPEWRQRKHSNITDWLWADLQKKTKKNPRLTCELDPQRGRRAAGSCLMHAWQHKVCSLCNTEILIRDSSLWISAFIRSTTKTSPTHQATPPCPW